MCILSHVTCLLQLNVFDQYDVSPAGEHFVSCKEASLYLQSYFKDRDNQKIDQMAANAEQVGNVASETVSKY